jgi:uncharacterized protein YndB with AHSA1/START domain
MSIPSPHPGTDPSRTLTISIAATPARVQAFITDPRNLPAWADGLGNEVREEGGQWFVTTPRGEVRIRFCEPNPFGIADHWVHVSPEEVVYVPIRVIPNGAGSEVLFTLFQPATMSAEQFAADAALVEADLRKLKSILEGQTTA